MRGNEEPVQRIVEQRLRAIGFATERVTIDADAALADPYAGYPFESYEGRTSVVGHLPGAGGGRSMHLSGHIDIVPVERPDLWTHDPWGGEVADGRLYGRASGDMKGGVAAYLIAAEAVAAVCPDRRGELLFSTVIEEECTGNGMWSVLRAGHVGDAVLVGESTGLRFAHAATGVVWCRLVAPGGAGHSMLATGEGAFDALARAVTGLRTVETEINEAIGDPDFAAVRERPYGMTVGRIEGGVWTASTPYELTAYVRFGFGPETLPEEIQARMRAAVEATGPGVQVHFEGFRARAHNHPKTGPLVDTLSAAHQRRARRAGDAAGQHRHGRHALRRERAGPLLRRDRRQRPRHRRVGRHRQPRAGGDRRRADDRRVDGMIRAATDVGGTFTDLVYFSTDPETGRQTIVTGKSDTTPPDFERGVMDVLHKSGVALSDIGFLAHGTTLIINALTERKGVKTGLITTEGFRDSLEIARGNRPDFFNLHYVKPAPFVPAPPAPRGARPHGPDAAPSARRSVLDELPGILADFREQGVQAVAICLLHSYANPAHEVAVLERVRELEPDAGGRRLAPDQPRVARVRAHEHHGAVGVRPAGRRALPRRARGAAHRRGLRRASSTSCSPTAGSTRSPRRRTSRSRWSSPARRAGSGRRPQLGRLIGEPNVLALDIGGTTAKCSLIEGGEVRIVSDYWIERSRRSAGYPIQLPVVDLVEIGNGGGSIAWVDDFGKLHVGPQSAGAVPGPVSYGRGGDAVTTTDANLTLGRINSHNFRGGEEADMAAVEARAVRARGHARDRAGRGRRAGVVRIANNNMINALKLVSVNRGYDPRDFTLVAFGGGGGMHAVALAAELGIERVVIPFAADVFSAWGMLMSDLRRDYFVTRLVGLKPESADAIDGLLAEVTDGALAQFEDEGVAAGQVRFLRYGKLRYENQEHSVEVALPDGPVDAEAVLGIAEAFHAAYEREYTYRLDHPVEFVGTHIVAVAEVGKLTPAPLPPATRTLAEARAGRRSVDFATEGVHESDVYTGELLEPGMRFQGPAVVESKGSTIVIHPGNEVSIDDYGNVIIELGGES